MRCAVNMGKLRNEAVKMRWVELTWWLIYRPVCSGNCHSFPSVVALSTILSTDTAHLGCQIAPPLTVNQPSCDYLCISESVTVHIQWSAERELSLISTLNQSRDVGCLRDSVLKPSWMYVLMQLNDKASRNENRCGTWQPSDA